MPSRIEAQSYPYLLVPPPPITPIVPDCLHYNHTAVNISQPARLPSKTFEMPTYHNRSKTHSAGVVASTGLLLAQGATAAVFNAADNVAVYWGQNSYNQASGDLAQQSLADYCKKWVISNTFPNQMLTIFSTNIDVIPMSFLVQITTGQGGQPVINLANAGNNCTLFPDSALLDCPQIGEDIKTCQDQYNKTVLLSVGGATYTEGGFASEDAAVKAANLVWDTFGPADSSSGDVAITNKTMTTGSTSASTHASGQNRTAPAAPSPTLDYDPQDPLWAVSLLAKITQTTEDASTFKTRTSGEASSAEKTADPTVSRSSGHKDASSKSTHKTGKAKQKRISTIYETHTDYAANHVETIVDATGTRFLAPGKVSSTSVESSPSATHELKNVQSTPKIRMVNYDGTHNTRRQATKALRPFHDAAVDGFDLDIEAPGQNFPAFANRLRALMDAEKKKSAKTDKNFYLTAAPQCPYPDLNNDAMLNGGVSFDAVSSHPLSRPSQRY